MDKCFACDRQTSKPRLVRVAGEPTTVFVGRDCFKKVESSGVDGYQPPLGGPRLVLISDAQWESADD